MPVCRVPWLEGFPDVVVHTTVGIRDAHADYAMAKAGAHGPAVRLSRDLTDAHAVDRIRTLLAGRKPLVVPVRAIEASGINLIPDAMAHDLGRFLGLEVTTEIVQTNTVGHTRASGYHRLVHQPAFDGEVVKGGEYLAVDDPVGLGSTLANLRGYLEAQGARLIGATTMSASRQSEVLALHAETLHGLKEKHGEALEQLWQTALGFGLERLTEAEAGYLFRSTSVDAIRAGMAAVRG